MGVPVGTPIAVNNRAATAPRSCEPTPSVLSFMTSPCGSQTGGGEARADLGWDASINEVPGFQDHELGEVVAVQDDAEWARSISRPKDRADRFHPCI
jgi:hypothetical protein